MPMTEADLDPDEDDRRLMALVAGGDDDALRLLVHRHHPRLVGYLTAQVGSQATAEELALEVFVRLHRAAGRWRPEAKLSTYLFHIAHNLLLNERRRRARKPASALEGAPEPADAAPRSEQAVAEIQEAFRHAVTQLPEEQRAAILLLVQQDLSYEAIAEVMGVGVPAIKTWIHRARLRLRELLGPDLRPGG
jgi:RNA polymerase sigma-70 factor (ECF subfamily)